MTFYAIYYQSDYYYTGTPQTMTVPVDGIYMVELWGAQYGGYTKVYMDLEKDELIYIIVGGWSDRLKQCGYNGGGAALSACDYALAHPGPTNSIYDRYHNDGSAGGMTHISRMPNVAVASPSINSKGSWDPAGTIAVAGGGSGNYDVGGGLTSPSVKRERGQAAGATQTSGWARGCGRSAYGAGGGGGGWWGGNIAASTDWINNKCCAKACTGGSGYINEDETVPDYENMTTVWGGSGFERKPVDRHYGFGRLTLIERK